MADRYWVGGHPTNNNWNQTGSGTTNWAATSGGAAGASVPGSSDYVFFDGNGNSNSTISATITISRLQIDAGYTSTITHNAVLTIGGAVWTMHSGFTIAGSSAITLSTPTITITSGGKTWPNNINMQTAETVTVAGLLLSNIVASLEDGSAEPLEAPPLVEDQLPMLLQFKPADPMR